MQWHLRIVTVAVDSLAVEGAVDKLTAAAADSHTVVGVADRTTVADTTKRKTLNESCRRSLRYFAGGRRSIPAPPFLFWCRRAARMNSRAWSDWQ
jgi:hypothetical protein